MKTWINTKCPLCDFKDRIEVDFSSFQQQQIVTCNSDAGGCDNSYIISYLFKPIVSVATVNDFKEIK